MTLVGPRPCLEWEAEMFPSEFDDRFAVRPGLTGLWQVSGRSTVNTLGMLHLDVHYARHQTLRGDAAIWRGRCRCCCAGTVPDEYAPAVSNSTWWSIPVPVPRWHALAATAAGSVFTSPTMDPSCVQHLRISRRTRESSPMPTDLRRRVRVGAGHRSPRRPAGQLPFSDRAEPVVADPATWSALVTMRCAVEAPLQIRCLDWAVPMDDTRFVRTSEAAWHCTPLGAPLPELHRSLSSAARRNIAAADRNGVHVTRVNRNGRRPHLPSVARGTAQEQIPAVGPATGVLRADLGRVRGR